VERLFHDWLARVQHGLKRFGKDERIDPQRLREILEEVLAAIEADDPATLVGDMTDLLDTVTRDGGAVALAQIGMANDEAIVNLVNEKAVEWSQDRAAELVGMKWVDGELVENPNADYAISESTRDLLRADITAAIEDGLSNDDLAAQLADAYAFSDERAEVIARTETAFADVAGNMIAYRESGVVEEKQWITGDGCCVDCKELDEETVPLDQDFEAPDGDTVDAPPLHPNCRCDVLPLISEPTDPFTED
jgi:SPP1 gp7 family putative phage head morphogenesis protein